MGVVVIGVCRVAPIDDGDVVGVAAVAAGVGAFGDAASAIGVRVDFHGHFRGNDAFAARPGAGVAQVFAPTARGRASGGGCGIVCGRGDGEGEAVAVGFGLRVVVVAGKRETEIGAQPGTERANARVAKAFRARVPDRARGFGFAAAQAHPPAGVAGHVLRPQAGPCAGGERCGSCGVGVCAVDLACAGAVSGLADDGGLEVVDVVFEGDGDAGAAACRGDGAACFAGGSGAHDACAGDGERAHCVGAGLGKQYGVRAYEEGADTVRFPEVEPGEGEVAGAECVSAGDGGLAGCRGEGRHGGGDCGEGGQCEDGVEQ